MPARGSGPSVNHLVLTVRDIEKSHKFYTEVLGFEKHGELDANNPLAGSKMWFYRGHPESHHDLALVQVRDPKGAGAAPEGWGGFFPETQVGINHVAIGYPTRDEWLERLKTIQGQGVKFVIRGNNGMTHSA